MLASQAGPLLFRTGYQWWLDAYTGLDGGHIIGAVLANPRAIVTGSSPPAGAWQTSRPWRGKPVNDCRRHRRLDGSAAMAGDQCDHGVQRGFERLGVALDLGQQQAALEGGQGGQGELVGIGPGAEPAELVHLL